MKTAIQKIGKPSDVVKVDYGINAAFNILESGIVLYQKLKLYDKELTNIC